MRRTRVAATATATLIAAATALSLTTPQAGAQPAGARPSAQKQQSATPSDNITPGWKTRYDQIRQRALEKRLRTGGTGAVEKVGRGTYGKVAQTGSYDELIAQPGPFAAFASRQLVGSGAG